jgi:hypothetical protein
MRTLLTGLALFALLLSAEAFAGEGKGPHGKRGEKMKKRDHARPGEPGRRGPGEFEKGRGMGRFGRHPGPRGEEGRRRMGRRGEGPEGGPEQGHWFPFLRMLRERLEKEGRNAKPDRPRARGRQGGAKKMGSKCPLCGQEMQGKRGGSRFQGFLRKRDRGGESGRRGFQRFFGGRDSDRGGRFLPFFKRGEGSERFGKRGGGPFWGRGQGQGPGRMGPMGRGGQGRGQGRMGPMEGRGPGHGMRGHGGRGHGKGGRRGRRGSRGQGRR